MQERSNHFLIEKGCLHGARQVSSPNFNARPDATDIQLIVIHNISLPPAQFGGGYIEDFFQNRLDHHQHPYFKHIEGLKVSAHLVILRTGEVIQCVNLNDRAWHAGRSSYLGRPECNDYSIGIELEGCDHLPFERIQYTVLSKVVACLQAYYPQIQQHLAGHSDIAPIRKTDPGPCFDWIHFRNLVSKEKSNHC
ncbi:1,6-anhydro-N-acetylmuramyl-L-alanine amidase AmpD [Acinetobacter sp. B5B]|uniref:1,6-anhydro-N-acetylmuramyl-L-alanine amidase AmpD n=1 Tax=Acinetobacter baretiae TaxID=2605383 RepID=UPI0018C26D5C|nr:1,6-anhydro-N-acetylmuramyl-L-alanine amidase AmpD [Acinetobacter baretiae]MBF7683413.1 1,6-anhydro-N-acetylmuramyl-L-alanine amidase AmpD [Acinetobacter baretiae]